MKTITAAVLFVLSFAADAQGHHQPYASHEKREVKALSDDEAKQYLSGAGMGYAKAAELNHFPGPMHVLELADALQLSAGQRRAVKTLMDEHKAQARVIGLKVVESERALEGLFRQPDVPQQALADAVKQAALLQGEYRLSHLETHRRMKPLLTAEQIAKYDALRGYEAAPGAAGGAR
jgi:Spy/CpxP family protein refolding chaperone